MTTKAESNAAEILRRLEILEIPIPVERIAKELGATVRHLPLDEELSGMIYKKGCRKLIGVNALHHIHRQRFTIAHEIGHLILHSDRIEKLIHVDKRFPVRIFHRDAQSTQGVDPIEIEANQFAAALLMPETVILKKLDGQYDIEDIPTESLAKKLQVSRQALELRIGNWLFFHSRRIPT